jgi:hypothetical protein
LEYKTPAWNFSPGSLGSPPQQYDGLLLAGAVTVTVTVMIVAAIVLFGALPSL